MSHLAWATSVFERAGTTDPRRRALQVWSALTDVPIGAVWLERERPADPAGTRRFREAVTHHAAGMPLAYAVGRVGFRTLDLLTDPRALIPRPETEGLVELVLDWTRGAGAGEGGTAVDLGTGTGCIALALALEGNFSRVIATDRSPAALALARANLERARPAVPVELRLGDWLAPLAGERCRVVVANPPYLRDDEWAALDAAVRDFEPQEALASGPDGLAAMRAILHRAAGVLVPGGLVALEIDERRAPAVETLARDAGWRRVAIHHDLFGRPRYLLAVVREDS
jgi:release factor glutamine methyltransferase